MMAATTEKAPLNETYHNVILRLARIPSKGETITARKIGVLTPVEEDDLAVRHVEETPVRECDLPQTDGHEGAMHANSDDVWDTRYEVTCETPEGELVRFTGWKSNVLKADARQHGHKDGQIAAEQKPDADDVEVLVQRGWDLYTHAVQPGAKERHYEVYATEFKTAYQYG